MADDGEKEEEEQKERLGSTLDEGGGVVEGEQAEENRKKTKIIEEHEVIEILSSSSEDDGKPSYDDNSSVAEEDWNSDEWDGPATEVADQIMYAVVSACPHGAADHSGRLHSSHHVRVLAVFKTKERAEERLDGIRSRLDAGGIGDGMIPGGTGWDEEVEVWVQPVNTFRH